MTNSETNSDEALACSLDADALAARKLAIRERVLAQALSTHTVTDGFELHFEATPDMRSTLDEFISLETSCCGFLEFERSEAAAGEPLTLAVTGPEGAQAMIRSFLASDAMGTGADAGRPDTRRSRWLRSGAAVTFVALVCCFGPALLVAAGVTGAARLGGSAWREALAVGVLSLPLLGWIWLRRPGPRPSSDSDRSG